MATKARLLVFWDDPQDPAEFDRHYREVHIPLANKLPGLRRYTVIRNARPVRGGEPHYLIAELDFDDMAAMKTALSSPEGQAVGADGQLMAKTATMTNALCELEDVF
ncbi:EthD family reductase [Phaeacidiphilus oryzae]|uniref:EthD family reductase n=1 Tax=Phaeacidiphilus oryzae TaxID=348818 RepID=UPI0005643B76|nr:EthD family reductase [Phaeacidiphilus oryzae]